MQINQSILSKYLPAFKIFLLPLETLFEYQAEITRKPNKQEIRVLMGAAVRFEGPPRGVYNQQW